MEEKTIFNLFYNRRRLITLMQQENIEVVLSNKKQRKFKGKKKYQNSQTLKIDEVKEVRLSLMNRPQTEESPYCPLEFTSLQLFQHSHPKHTLPPSSFTLIFSPSHILPEDVSLQHLSQLNFPIRMYKLKDLVSFSCLLLQKSQFCENTFSSESLNRLVSSLAVSYNSVSYHNFSHAFSLTLLNYQCFLKEPNLRSQYTDEEYFYIMIAGLSHDINHKGTNNNFEVKRQSALAQQFDNASVLQNMHLQTLWNILKQNAEINFLLKATNANKAKHIITQLILSTDMAFHNQNIDRLKQAVQKGHSKDPSLKWFMAQQIFHACDIGNPCTDYDNYISWAALLSHEFNQQTVLQQQLKLEITQCFIYHDLSTLYKDQIWFVGNIVYPLWKQLSLTYDSFTDLLKGIENNLERVNQEFQLFRQ